MYPNSHTMVLRLLRLGGGLLAALAVAAPAVSAEAGGTNTSAQSTPVTLEEVVVTAQKRNERLQDVPVPVTAISSDALTERSQNQFSDYFNEIPSVSLNSTGDGAQHHRDPGHYHRNPFQPDCRHHDR